MTIELLHGDYAKVIGTDSFADLIFTSPPYNIGSKSPAIITNRRFGGYDAKSYRAIREYKDDFPEDIYQENQIHFLNWAHDHLNKNGIVVYNHKLRRKNNRMINPIEWISKVTNLVLIDEIIWDRGSTHNHCNKMLWQHTERLYVLRRSCDTKYKFLNTSNLKYRSDVWRIPRAKNNGHNAPFPLALAQAVIEAWTDVGDMVMDPYMGSGTVALACAVCDRNFIGAEKLKKYYILANDRVQTEGFNNV